MQRGVRAFTIVEFTIAVAIATVIGAAAISRYNAYIRQVEFTAGGERIAACLQRASIQSRANTTGSPIRYTRATITSTQIDDVNSAVDCHVETFSSKTAGVTNTTTLLLQGTPAETGTNQSFRVENAFQFGTTGTATVRVVFGSLENGVPLGLSFNGAITLQPDDSGLNSYVPFGTGFTISGSKNTIRIDSSLNAICGVIQMTNVGTPVVFKRLDSCT